MANQTPPDWYDPENSAIKPGHKTTEFYMTMCLVLVGIVLKYLGAKGLDSTPEYKLISDLVEMAFLFFPGATYILSRGMEKRLSIAQSFEIRKAKYVADAAANNLAAWQLQAQLQPPVQVPVGVLQAPSTAAPAPPADSQSQLLMESAAV